MRSKRLFILFAATLLVGVACNRIDTNDPDGEKEGEDKVITELNGTTILSESNIIGQVTDNTGKPLEGIPVTDGYKYTLTDKNGVYQMASHRQARKAYLSIPAGYEIPLDPETHLPAFYSPGIIVRAKQNRCDFKLTPLSQPEDKITLVMIGDPQCQTESEVQRYKDETIPSIQSALTGSSKYVNPYAFTLGDITHDSSILWPDMVSSMSNVKYGSKYLPFFQTIGNHDHYAKAPDDYSATENFLKYFGPTDYSINRGNVHIIMMDNVVCKTQKTNSSPDKGTWEYDAGFTTGQWKWLQQDLELVKDKNKKMVVLCLHIPFRAGSASGGSNVNKNGYYDEVLKALKEFKEAHIMIGHTHYPMNWIHNTYRTKSGLPVYEHIHGAACGGWWSCDSNVNGAPNGYSLYEVDAVNATMINWVAKGTKNDYNFQMRVYDGNAEYTGSKGYQYKWTTTSNNGAGAFNVGGTSNIFAKGNSLFKDAFVAAIWNDDSVNWKVELWQDGAKVGDFKRVAEGSSTDVCVCSFFFNELGKNTSTWATSTASHYWYFVPESKDPSSEKNWEVRAFQTIPSSKIVNEYKCTTFTTNYAGF